jgi:hypothetical protein
LPQHRRGGGRPVGDQQRQAVEQQVDQTRRRRRAGQGLGGAGDLQQITGARETPGEQGRHPRAHISLARQA